MAGLLLWPALWMAPPALSAAAPGIRPTLAVLPPEPARSGNLAGADSLALAVVEQALRLELGQDAHLDVPSREELEMRLDKRRAGWPSRCGTAGCLQRLTRLLSVDMALGAEVFLSPDSLCRLRLLFADARGGGEARVWQVDGDARGEGLIHLARQAAAGLQVSAGKAGNAGRAENPGAPRHSGAGRRQAWVGAGLLGLLAGTAFVQGQLFQSDEVERRPARSLLPSGGSFSGLRGFFAEPGIPPRYAAQGDAGVAEAGGALAMFLNPAGLSRLEREAAALVKSTLPGGVPSFSVSYAAPGRRLAPGYGLRYEGDELAGEITAHAAGAFSLTGAARFLPDLRLGAAFKGYLVQVGEGGTGLDRSRGHSAGAGLDLGLQWPLFPRVHAGVLLRDAPGILWHRNTFTGRGYMEILPPGLVVGAAYRVSDRVRLVMDGRKGLYADQVDQVHLGGETSLFHVLQLRAGLGQVFGEEPVRRLTLGFGLASDGLDPGWTLDKRLEIAYSYALAFDPHPALGGSQSFSVEVGF